MLVCEATFVVQVHTGGCHRSKFSSHCSGSRMNLLCDLSLFRAIANTYAQKSSEKERLIDHFLLFTVVVFLAVVGNYIVFGDFPYNAFLGAIFCCLGIFSSTLALRMRISKLERKAGEQKKPPQKVVAAMKSLFAEYVFIVFVIFSVCVCYMP